MSFYKNGVITSSGFYEASNGYILLEYIEGSGTQYINTNYCISSEKVQYGVRLSFNSTDSNTRLFGREKPTYSGILWNTTGRLWVGSSGDVLNVGSWSLNTFYDITIFLDSGKSTVIANDIIRNASYSGSLVDATYPLWLFAVNNNGSKLGTLDAKVSRFEITDNGILKRCMIPVKRISDNAIGMYDTVNGVFYGNAGTGTFIAGPVIGYQPSITTTSVISNNFIEI